MRCVAIPAIDSPSNEIAPDCRWVYPMIVRKVVVLPGAVAADEADELARADRERDAAQDAAILDFDDEVLDRQHLSSPARACRPSCRRPPR
jgi:hypothetical protein